MVVVFVVNIKNGAFSTLKKNGSLNILILILLFRRLKTMICVSLILVKSVSTKEIKFCIF